MGLAAFVLTVVPRDDAPDSSVPGNGLSIDVRYGGLHIWCVVIHNDAIN